jgi:site-specific recombinase XerD
MKIASTAVQNLVKDAETKVYYARVRCNGRLFIRSLDTKVFTTAKLCLPDKLKEIRDSVPEGERIEGGLERDATFEDAAKAYSNEINRSTTLQPASRDARLRPLATLRRTWPELFKMEIRRIQPVSIENYIADFERGKWPYLPRNAKSKTLSGNSPSTFNKLVTCLREIFQLAVKHHVIGKNPATSLTYKPLRKKLLQLPNKTQFGKIVRHIRTKAGKGRIAGDLVEGLAYSGLRVEEANSLLWEDLDHERRMITVKGTKTEGSARVIPMTPAFHALTLRMKTHRESVARTQLKPSEKVFEASEALMSLRNACAAVGAKKMTHHDLRHLFATTCIESGVDVPTVAKWLGHVDGGVLAMETYGHVRPDHSNQAALKVSF